MLYYILQWPWVILKPISRRRQWHFQYDIAQVAVEGLEWLSTIWLFVYKFAVLKLWNTHGGWGASMSWKVWCLFFTTHPSDLSSRTIQTDVDAKQLLGQTGEGQWKLKQIICYTTHPLLNCPKIPQNCSHTIQQLIQMLIGNNKSVAIKMALYSNWPAMLLCSLGSSVCLNVNSYHMGVVWPDYVIRLQISPTDGELGKGGGWCC